MNYNLKSILGKFLKFKKNVIVSLFDAVFNKRKYCFLFIFSRNKLKLISPMSYTKMNHISMKIPIANLKN